MIGKCRPQMPLFDVGNVFDLRLPKKSFHAQLAQAATRLFKDDDFAAFYKEKKGRPSVPPSLLALVTLLQHEAGVSDDEAIRRTAYDLRWAAVLRKEGGQPLCAKSTFQLFRHHMVLHPEVRTLFTASLNEAKRTGLLKGNALKIAIDTKPIRGRGAVQDTFNLLATGIRKLGRALAAAAQGNASDWWEANHLQRYHAASVKGSAAIDWSEEDEKNGLLTQIVADAKRLLVLAGASTPRVREAALLLEQLLLQDVEVTTTPEGKEQTKIKQETVKGRIPCASDPDVRRAGKARPSASTDIKRISPSMRTARSSSLST